MNYLPYIRYLQLRLKFRLLQRFNQNIQLLVRPESEKKWKLVNEKNFWFNFFGYSFKTNPFYNIARKWKQKQILVKQSSFKHPKPNQWPVFLKQMYSLILALKIYGFQDTKCFKTCHCLYFQKYNFKIGYNSHFSIQFHYFYCHTEKGTQFNR